MIKISDTCCSVTFFVLANVQYRKQSCVHFNFVDYSNQLYIIEKKMSTVGRHENQLHYNNQRLFTKQLPARQPKP